MSNYRIAVIPGDGIGKEVMPVALEILGKVAANCGFSFDCANYDWSCADYAKSGRIMPKDGITQLGDSDAILLGAVGWPGVPDHVSLWDLLLPIRREFQQYVNLRPVRLLPGIMPKVMVGEDAVIDYWIVRENTEGEYSKIGGRLHSGTNEEMVSQVATFTRKGTDRIIEYAFDLAKKMGRKHVSSATKSNGIFHSMPFWDERFAAIAKQHPEVECDQHHIDILAARLVTQPGFFDVIVASNLFGDILSDLGPATMGTIAIAPSANLNPSRDCPSMFEPVHGSAPDIAGKNLANPIGMVWSLSMMLGHLGQKDAATLVMKAIERYCSDKDAPKTRDLGGTASTSDVGERILTLV